MNKTLDFATATAMEISDGTQSSIVPLEKEVIFKENLEEIFGERPWKSRVEVLDEENFKKKPKETNEEEPLKDSSEEEQPKETTPES